MSNATNAHGGCTPAHVAYAPDGGKTAELRTDAGRAQAHASALDGIAPHLSDLATAQQLTKHAARVGFNWPDIAQVWGKLQEELTELEAELRGGNRSGIAAELGDVLFAVVNLARWLDVDAEGALRATNAKFRYRFSAIEQGARASGRPLAALRLDEMELLWVQAKR